MKKINILYWTFTILFGGFMMFSAVPNILLSPESVAFVGQLGFPNHFIHFIGVAKALGVIGILVPGFHALKNGHTQNCSLILSVRFTQCWL